MKSLLMIGLLAIGSVSHAQHGIHLNPGERLVAIDGAPVSIPGSTALETRITSEARWAGPNAKVLDRRTVASYRVASTNQGLTEEQLWFMESMAGTAVYLCDKELTLCIP